MIPPLIWVPVTFAASCAQVIRNGAQAHLTARIGTLGATQVRFVFGLPFAAMFLVLYLAASHEPIPVPDARALGWTALGAVCQIGGTALMLVVMGQRAFGVAYAYIKTEPVIVAVLGAVVLGDRLPPLAWLAVVTVTAGVLVASVPPRDYRRLLGETRMISAGIGAGALFGISSIAFRGGIVATGSGSLVARSLLVLAMTLALQTVLLGAWLALRDRAAFAGSLREWRQSFGAGFAGALSSALFFTAFALTPAANVRSFALVELPIAALASGRVTGRWLKPHELAGMAVIMAGVVALLVAQAT